MENSLKSSSDDMELLVQSHLKTLGTKIVKFAWQLLHICYLSQTFGQGDCTNIFPRQVEDLVVGGDFIIQVIAI
jgi:hypothetical protein